MEEEEKYEQWRKDPKNWKLGIFYFNREDHRIFPPKRNPILGWTVNFAQPRSVIALLLFLLFVAMILFFIDSKK